MASLITAILPLVSLGITFSLNYASFKSIEVEICSRVLDEMEPLQNLHDEWWEHIMDPPFKKWPEEAQRALI